MRNALILLLLLAISGTAFGQSRVVPVKDTNAVRGSVIDTAVVRIMMDAGIKALTDSTTVGGAWKSCFPGIASSQNICIKLNCIEYRLSSHPQVTQSVLSGLVQMPIGATNFRPWRLIAFDRRDTELTAAGYTLRSDTLGMRCVGTNQAGWGYQTKAYNIFGATERFSRVLTDSAAFMINLCVLKDCIMVGFNFTLNMKNHYGTINSPGTMHDSLLARRQMPEVERIIRDSLGGKEKVYLIDGLFAMYNGGPYGSPQATPRTLILSRDPVACDSLGVELINNLRRSRGLQPRESRYLAYAESIGLGSRNLQVIRITNPSAVALEPKPEERQSDFALLPSKPNPFTGRTEISFLLPRSGAARVEVYNALGARVKTLVSGNFLAGRHTAVWDGRSESGRRSPSGIYVFRLSFGQAGIERSVSLIH